MSFAPQHDTDFTSGIVPVDNDYLIHIVGSSKIHSPPGWLILFFSRLNIYLGYLDSPIMVIFLLPTAKEGNVFRSVCHSVRGGRGLPPNRQAP